MFTAVRRPVSIDLHPTRKDPQRTAISLHFATSVLGYLRSRVDQPRSAEFDLKPKHGASFIINGPVVRRRIVAVRPVVTVGPVIAAIVVGIAAVIPTVAIVFLLLAPCLRRSG